jgi:hypothetical protein
MRVTGFREGGRVVGPRRLVEVRRQEPILRHSASSPRNHRRASEPVSFRGLRISKDPHSMWQPCSKPVCSGKDRRRGLAWPSTWRPSRSLVAGTPGNPQQPRMATRGLSRSGAQRRHAALEPVCRFDRNGRSCSHRTREMDMQARSWWPVGAAPPSRTSPGRHDGIPDRGARRRRTSGAVERANERARWGGPDCSARRCRAPPSRMGPHGTTVRHFGSRGPPARTTWPGRVLAARRSGIRDRGARRRRASGALKRANERAGWDRPDRSGPSVPRHLPGRVLAAR